MRVRAFRNKHEHAIWRAQMGMRNSAMEARQMVKDAAAQEAARELIGDLGHYVQAVGDKYGVFTPDGTLQAMRREKLDAEAAAYQLATTGSISV